MSEIFANLTRMEEIELSFANFRFPNNEAVYTIFWFDNIGNAHEISNTFERNMAYMLAESIKDKYPNVGIWNLNEPLKLFSRWNVGAVFKECEGCNGDGTIEDDCPECNGGLNPPQDENDEDEICDECHGSGHVDETCETCNGTGEIILK